VAGHWTDGRKLPPNPPIQRYLGYAVGRWEGDTFVVESNGYDDRFLACAAPASVLELGDRVAIRIATKCGSRNATSESITIASGNALTVTDPKVYMTPWTTTGTNYLDPNTEMAENFCVPSDSIHFNSENTIPRFRSSGGLS